MRDGKFNPEGMLFETLEFQIKKSGMRMPPFSSLDAGQIRDRELPQSDHRPGGEDPVSFRHGWIER